MANTGFKGVDVRQAGTALVFRALLQTSAGALLPTGTTTLKLYELQSDATIKSYDFNDNTFKTTALTTETLALTHRPGNNGATPTGIWTAALATLTGFARGAVYLAVVNNTGASPADQAREFQYGSAEGDLAVTAAGQVGPDWANVGSPATTVSLSGTTVSTGQAVASVAGNVAGSVGSIAGVTFPTRFNLLSVDTDGAVDVATVGGEPADLVTPPLESDVTLVGGVAIPTPAVAGYLPVDIAKVMGDDPTIDTDPTSAVLTADGLDAVTVEAGLNLRQAVSILLAYVAGVKSGVTTTTPTVKNPAGTVTRAAPTVDADGNCSAVTLSPPA